MKGFFKLAWSIIKRNLSLFLALSAVEMCAVALVSGMTTAYGALSSQVSDYVKSCNYPSLTVSTSLKIKNQKYLEQIQAIEGVDQVCYRIETDASCLHNGDALYSRVSSYGGDNFMNYTVVSEISSSANYRISASKHFASNGNIALGDELTLTVMGFDFTFVVDKIVDSCEGYSEKQSAILPSGSGNYGYLYLEESVVKKLGLGLFFNQILVLGNGTVSNAELSSRVREASSLSIESIETYEQSQVYLNIGYNLDPLKAVSYNLPAIFFLFSMVVAVLFTFLMAKSFQHEMGVLLCLGYRKRYLYYLFAFIGFVGAMLGAAMGLGLGYGIAFYGYKAYFSHFKIPFLLPTFDALGTSLGVVLCLAIATSAAFASSYFVIHRLTPMEATSAVTESHSSFLKFKKMPLRMKLEGNRALRNLKANIFSVVCMSLSFAMIYSAFSFAYSRRAASSQLFDERMDFTALVLFSSEDPQDVQKAFDQDSNILQYEIIDWKESELIKGNSSATYAFVGLEADQTMMKIPGTNQDYLPNPTSGAILDTHTAEFLGIGIGETFSFYGKEVKVEALSSQSCFRLNYLPKAIFEDCVDSYSLCAPTSCASYATLKKNSANYENCTSVLSLAEMERSLQRSISTTDTAVYIIVGMSSLLSIAVIANIKASELINERRRVALERMMGYSLPSISFSWLLFDLAKTILSLGIGYGLGIPIASFILGSMDNAVFSFPYVNVFLTFGISAAILLLLQLLSHGFIHVKLSRLNLAEETKGRE